MTVCHIVNTSSRPITEVKQCRARSVVGWVTAVKSWFNLPFTKTPRVVYTVAESLAPDRCCNLGSSMETYTKTPSIRPSGSELMKSSTSTESRTQYVQK
jgi:hypothetical protein